MSKLCPICNKEWPDEFQVCPVDGTVLINKPQTPSIFSLNLGDANAISGGVNMSDNHSTNNNTVNTSNVDSHNVINTTNHITQIEREKRPEEIRRENMITFRKACQDAFVNGVLSETKKRQLDELQFQLNLDDATTLSIIEDVRAKSQNKATVLGRVQQVTLKNIKTAISNNQLDIITRLKPQLTAMIQKFSDEELQYTYYMLQAVLNPKECISQYEASVEDCYWQAFWTAVAYRREGNTEESEKLVVDVEYKWSESAPQEDVLILATINAIHDGDQDTAHSMFDTIEGKYSFLLEELISTIYCILNKDTMDERDYQDQIRLGKFYAEHLFAVKSAARKEEPKVAATPKVEAKSEPESVENQPKEEKSEGASNDGKIEVSLADLLAKCKDEHGYLRTLDKNEIPEIKTQLLSHPEDNYQVQFLLGQLYLQESKSAQNTLLAYNAIRQASEHGVQEAGAYLAYFYLYGKVVKENLDEVERRINIESNFKKIPFFVQLLVDMYKKQGNAMLADVWEGRLKKLNK